MAITKTSWKKGKSGNNDGRPLKEESLTYLMKTFLQNIPEGQKETYKEIFIKKTYKMAINGDIAAIKLIWNYVDGMPKEAVEHSGEIKITGLEIDF